MGEKKFRFKCHGTPLNLMNELEEIKIMKENQNGGLTLYVPLLPYGNKSAMVQKSGNISEFRPINSHKCGHIRNFR